MFYRSPRPSSPLLRLRRSVFLPFIGVPIYQKFARGPGLGPIGSVSADRDKNPLGVVGLGSLLNAELGAAGCDFLFQA